MTSSDTSPQLMQLCESEALCIFHKHYCCIGNINPNLDNRRRYKDINLPGSECVHNFLLLCCLHFSMQSSHPNRAIQGSF